MNEPLPKDALLLQRLRTWPVGEIGKQAADTIEELQRSLRREENARAILAETNERLTKEIGLLVSTAASPLTYDDWKKLFEKGAILP